jgi:hypothetical protein
MSKRMIENKCDWCLVKSITVFRVYFDVDGKMCSYDKCELVYWLCERCRGDLRSKNT